MVLKCMFVALCLGMTFGMGYPPSHAQMSNEDAVQDNNIVALNRHVESSDSRAEERNAELNKRIDALREETNKLGKDMAEMQGENRIAYAVLGMIGTTSIAVSFKRKAV